MKTNLILLFFLLSMSGFAQSFNGDYTSYKTSYKDDGDSANNFAEETTFNISILIEKDASNGRIVIQDPRMPDRPLIYKVLNRIDFSEFGDEFIGVYTCQADHLQTKKQETLTFYYNKNEEFNLMVRDDFSSQVFFGLTLQ